VIARLVLFMAMLGAPQWSGQTVIGFYYGDHLVAGMHYDEINGICYQTGNITDAFLVVQAAFMRAAEESPEMGRCAG
jgi:hypothetical protein